MKKLLCTLLLCLLVLTGCAAPDAPDTGKPEDDQQPQQTAPLHSPLYLPDLAADEVLLYFNEVCLDAEISHSGDAKLLQKWVAPICYRINGDYTAEDMAVFSGFVTWLNTVEGFPGIREANSGDAVNLQIYFCKEEEMVNHMGDWAYGMDGAVTFWYDNDVIHDAIICCRSDIDQEIRNSVILEELYNGLGPIQDTVMRPDSIIYAEFTTPQQPSAADELLLRLLYHPDLQPGMNAAQCESVIRNLYY